jgi:surfeit locus 1 family protein
VLRRLLTLRWLALSVLAVLLVVVMSLLGVWQWHRAQPSRYAAAVSAPPVGVTTVVRAAQPLPTYAVGRLVTASGTYDAEHQFVVPGRRLNGQVGSWVLSPLRLPDGSGVIVVRGWTGTPEGAGFAPTGPVDVTGRVQSAERTGLAAAGAGPELSAVDPAVVAPRLSYPLLDGYVVLTAQSPPANAALTPVPPLLPTSGDGLHPRNLAYALQWWVFAAFVMVGWWRMLRDDVQPPVTPEPAPAPVAPNPALDRRRRQALEDAVSGDDELAAYNRYLAELDDAADSRGR